MLFVKLLRWVLLLVALLLLLLVVWLPVVESLQYRCIILLS
jgi:hypothetical protein